MSQSSAREAEQAAYDRLQIYTLSHPDPSFPHQHLVDAWAAQRANAETSNMGLCFALVGLYLAVERNYDGRQVQRVHMALARQRKSWPSLPLPRERGVITALEVEMAPPGAERDAAIKAWCASVWTCFSDCRPQVADLLADMDLA